MDVVERVARAIADDLGDDFDSAFVTKVEWVAARGERGGRYRDINEPFQGDYFAASRAAIAALFDWMAEPSEAVADAGERVTETAYDAQMRVDALWIWCDMLAAMRKEALGDATPPASPE